MIYRIGTALAGLLLAFSLMGCNGGGEKTPENGGKTPKAATGGKKAIKAGAVTDLGGVDDKSFNASAWAGLQRAKNDLGADAHFLESREATDYRTNLGKFAQEKYDVVFGVGIAMGNEVKAAAEEYPDIKFVIIDGADPGRPNAAAIQFREEEGSFLVGYLAASMTKKNKIGFVGGREIDLIKKFEAGYMAGAKTANPKVEVIASYTGDWDDVAKGKEQALAQFKQGADIIFHAAGKSGIGVLKAAEQQGPGYYGIGVDADQDWIAPGRVLTSMMKRVDNAVFEEVKAVQEGKFAPGPIVLGIKEKGIGLSEMKYTKKDIPSDVLKKIDALSEKIASGEIKVPTKVEEVAAFQPPKI